MNDNYFEDDDPIFKEIEDIIKDGESLEDQQRVGRYKRDISVQTNASELLPLTTLREQNAIIQTDMEILRKDVAVKLKCIEAKFDTQIQREAIDLYVSVQKRGRNMEEMHKERIAMLQQSYQHQLVDAINVIKGNYKKCHMQRGNSVPGDLNDNRIAQGLLAKIEEKNLEILTLTEQVKEYEERLNSKSDTEVADGSEREWLAEENRRLEDENEKLKDDIDSLHIDLEQLGDELQVKENNIDDLADDLKQLTIKAEEERKNLQKVTLENSQLKAQLETERETGKKKLNQLKKDMEKEINNIETQRKEEALAAKNMMEQHRQEQRDMDKQQEAQKARQAAERAAAAAAPAAALASKQKEAREDKELGNLEKIIAEQKAEIQRYKKELRITTRAWEKRFEILKKNFHAVKDEMFLRNNLQRQAAALHYASVSYMLDVPGKNPGKHQGFTAGTPLPHIGAGTQRTDHTSGTVVSSCVSDRDTLSCIDHEFQPQNEDEEEDEDFGGDLPLPLPPPPNRQIPAFTQS
ncbi:uncharacterized protein C10orf67 homolog, mitochondrial [Sardina pilchardus]|uniref:uncharacterized protein C10orf67 homolog, mitochondrial n=1 Tax=Sardina pilchardus TaxID=27697 RepID=UPI002E1365AE